MFTLGSRSRFWTEVFGYGKVLGVNGGLEVLQVAEVRDMEGEGFRGSRGIGSLFPNSSRRGTFPSNSSAFGLGGPRTSTFRGTKFPGTRFQPSSRKVTVRFH